MIRFAVASLLFLATAGVSAQANPDLIITNANVRTLDARNSRARAVAVRDGRIVAVGSAASVGKLAGSNTKVIDAGGRLMIPGFNDAHVHLTGIGNLFSHLNIKGLSRRQVVREIARYVGFLPKGRWILGRGWHDVSILPTLSEIDAVSPDDPVLIYSDDYSRAMANTAALASARVTSKTGIVTGSDLDRVRGRLPPNFANNWPEIVETAGNYAASLGVTSVQDVHSDDLFEVLNQLANRGRLSVRVYDCIGLSDRQKAIKAGQRAASGTPMVRRGCLKGSADGEPGEVAELTRDISEADKAGLQVMVHAIGARSIANILTAFENVYAANGRRDRRYRVEHAARMPLTDIRRFKRSELIASMQPYLFYSGPQAGDEYRRIFDAGTAVAFGSDASITSFDPLLSIHAAVNSGRRSITVDEAVRAYTIGSAFSEFQEGEKGTIEVGKLADLIVLSDDIFSIDRRRIKDARVVMTILGGRVVYDGR